MAFSPKEWVDPTHPDEDDKPRVMVSPVHRISLGPAWANIISCWTIVTVSGGKALESYYAASFNPTGKKSHVARLEGNAGPSLFVHSRRSNGANWTNYAPRVTRLNLLPAINCGWFILTCKLCPATTLFMHSWLNYNYSLAGHRKRFRAMKTFIWTMNEINVK